MRRYHLPSFHLESHHNRYFYYSILFYRQTFVDMDHLYTYYPPNIALHYLHILGHYYKLEALQYHHRDTNQTGRS